MKGKGVSINIQRAKYVGMDLFTTFIAFLLFDIFRYGFQSLGSEFDSLSAFLLSPTVLSEQFIIPLCLLFIYWISGYYNNPFGRSRLIEFSTTLFSTLFSAMLIYLILLINDPMPRRTLNYELLLSLFLILFIVVYSGRIILTGYAIKKLSRKEWSFNTVIIGDSDKAIALSDRLKNSQSRLGYHVIGHIPIENEKSSIISHPTLTDFQFKSLCEAGRIDQIIISADTRDEAAILANLYKYFTNGVPIKISPTSLSFLTSHIRIKDIIAEPFIDLTSPTISDFQKNVKRIIDVLVSLSFLILFSPLYLIIALAVKAGSPGPVIYSQDRIGYRQKPFRIFKFRSMRTDAEAQGPKLSTEDDPRITKIGHFLRKYRLDELPQFWNVLKGDMSLVGPRPEREYYIKKIVEKAPHYTLVHQVKPGITSWGMVKFGYAKDVNEMVERSRFDMIYLSNMSIAVDFKIMIHTIKTVIMGEGV